MVWLSLVSIYVLVISAKLNHQRNSQASLKIGFLPLNYMERQKTVIFKNIKAGIRLCLNPCSATC